LIIFSLVTRNTSLKIISLEEWLSLYSVPDIPTIPEYDSRSNKALKC